MRELTLRFATAGATVLLALACATTPPSTQKFVPKTDAGASGDAVSGTDSVAGADGVAAPDGPVTTPVDGATAADGASEPVTGAAGPDLVVDANRDGIVNGSDPADQDNEMTQNTKFGASFLPNLDDDDGDKVEDAYDEAINGIDDALDLARVVARPWPTAPDGTKATLTLDAEGAKHVRLWLKDSSGQYLLIGGAWGACVPVNHTCTGAATCCKAWDDCNPTACSFEPKFPLSTAMVRDGLELAIEGIGFRMTETGWDGTVTLTYAVEGAPDKQDSVKLSVSPWMLFGNTSTFDKVRSAGSYKEFVADLSATVSASGATYLTYNNWNDHWTQDLYQTGWTSVPAAGGKVHGMRFFNGRSWGRQGADGKATLQLAPLFWLRNNVLGKDAGIFGAYLVPWKGNSLDSHGNHDLIPPYVNGKDSYPIGRILIGGDIPKGQEEILPETKAFYNAQRVQGPFLRIHTAWLAVGHVDEILSYVPSATPRGWRLMVASDALAKQMYEKWQKDGHGAVAQFVGKQNYDPKTDKKKDAKVAIDDVLKDIDLMQWSQQAGVETKKGLDAIVEAIGLSKEEIIAIPTLTEEIGGKVAWNPGTVNSLVIADHIYHPNPFGPEIGGKDAFKKDLEDRLGTGLNLTGKAGKGMGVHFVDDWNGYHILLGEVHCGTNPEGPPSVEKWWEVVR
ncbi:MAG: hypothetical protein EXR79_14570 [Myxococcales bacterium]|nr:hypothetical protein [Myxococcales bacterium]